MHLHLQKYGPSTCKSVDAYTVTKVNLDNNKLMVNLLFYILISNKVYNIELYVLMVTLVIS